MQCKSCNTELPKHAKVCPRCGALVGKKSGNLKVIAIIGLVIAFIGGLLPFVQNSSDILSLSQRKLLFIKITPSFHFMLLYMFLM